MEGLNAEEQQVEERAIKLLKDDSTALIATYREKFGSIVGTDLARELFPDYSESLESRLKYALAVQKSASALSELIFNEILGEKHGSAVLFTAGGTGAGKTSAIMRNTEHELESYLTDIDYLEGVKYDSDALRKSLHEELDYAFAQGNISKALYAASGGTQST